MGTVYCFERFEFSAGTGELRRFGVRIRLQPQPAAILLKLVQHPGEVVQRLQLRSILWDANVFVDYERNLNRSVNKLRQVLGDSADNPRFIETIPGQGYRFIAPVRIAGESQQDTAPQPPISRPNQSLPEHHGFAWQVALGAVLLFFVLCIVGYVLFARSHTSSPKPTVVIAVLPVINLTGNHDLEYLTDGLTDAIIAELSRQDQHVAVIARTSIMPYKNSDKSVRQIGHELHANYILENSLETSGPRMRLTSQLIEVENQTHIWSQTFDRASADLLDFEREIAVSLATRTSIGLSKQTAKPAHIENADARRAYLLGIFLRDTRPPAEWDLAVSYLNTALTKDPQYEAPYTALAFIHWASPAYKGYDLAAAEQYARRALDLNPYSAEAHAQLAAVFSQRSDWNSALEELKRATQLEPSLASAHYILAATLREAGHPAEAIPEYERTFVLAPTQSSAYANAALAYADVGQFAHARELIDHSLELRPDSVLSIGNRGMVFLIEKNFLKAAASFKEAADRGHENSYRAAEAHCLARAGHRKEAQQILEMLLNQRDSDGRKPEELVLVYAGFGRAPDTVRALQAMLKEREVSWLQTPAASVYLEPIKSDPQFLRFARTLHTGQR